MPISLDTVVIAGSTGVLKCEFTNSDDDAVTPKTLTWTLMDQDGEVINEREDEIVAAPASTTYIAISGNDTALQDETNSKETRIVKISATYDSNYGSDLPLIDYATFDVINPLNLGAAAE